MSEKEEVLHGNSGTSNSKELSDELLMAKLSKFQNNSSLRTTIFKHSSQMKSISLSQLPQTTKTLLKSKSTDSASLGKTVPVSDLNLPKRKPPVRFTLNTTATPSPAKTNMDNTRSPRQPPMKSKTWHPTSNVVLLDERQSNRLYTIPEE
jgi:hypothetical protein